MANNIKITPGKILVADPFMTETNFRRSVICLCDHSSEDGSIGFILNKPINIKLEDLIGDVSLEDEFKVFYGGPVATDTIHYIHNLGDLLEDSVKVTQGVYWGGNYEKLKFLMESGMVRKENIRFYVGYSGWSPGQLVEELEFGSWMTSDVHANYVFKSKASKLWKQVLNNKGNTFSVIAQMPNGISLN